MQRQLLCYQIVFKKLQYRRKKPFKSAIYSVFFSTFPKNKNLREVSDSCKSTQDNQFQEIPSKSAFAQSTDKD